MTPNPRRLLTLVLAFSLTAQPVFAQVPASTTGDSAVPLVVGLPLKQAVARIRAAGLSPKARVGRLGQNAQQALSVYAQDPAPGTKVRRGSQLTITFYAADGDNGLRAAALANDASELVRVVAVPFLDNSTEAIDSRTGLFHHEVTDVQVPAGRVALKVSRTLRLEPTDQHGGREHRGLLGSRWRLNWEKRVLFSDRLAMVDEGAGPTVLALGSDGVTFQSANGDTLSVRENFAVRTHITGVREFYGPEGRLIGIDHGNGNKVLLTYDAAGRLERVSGPFGSYLQFTTDARGILTGIKGSNGATVTYVWSTDDTETDPAHVGTSLAYEYDARQMLTKIVHPRSGATKLSYDDRQRVTSRTWADGAAERFEFQDAKRTWKHIDAAGQATLGSWRADHRAVAITSPMGYVSLVEYDDSGRLIRVSGPSGKDAVIDYDSSGQIEEVIDSVRGTTKFQSAPDSFQVTSDGVSGPATETYTYDEQRNLVRSAIKGKDSLATSYEYFPNGLIRTMHNGVDSRFDLEYDDRGQVIQVTDSAGRSTRFDYDALGNLTREIDPQGRETKRQYNEHGWLIQETDPAGATTKFEYTAGGLVSRRIDANGAATDFEYDARGRLVAEKDPAGRVARITYTPRGRIESVTDAAGGTTRFRYDPVGNPVSQTNALGAVRGTMHDADGNLVTAIDWDGSLTQFEYSADGSLLEVRDPIGTITRFGYDKQGRLARLIQPNDQVTRYVYNDQDQLTMVLPPRGAIRKYEYDESDHIRVMQDGESVIRYEYDELGRRTRQEHSSGLRLEYQYDGADELTGWQDNLGGGAKIERDANGRPAIVATSSGAVTRYQYDANGSVSSVIDPLGGTTQFERNKVGDLLQVSDTVGNHTVVEYDKAGRLASLVGPGGNKTQYQYDVMGNPLSITGAKGNSITMTYDAIGRLVHSKDAKGQTTKLAYNGMGQLVRKELADGVVIKYEYDSFGNLTLVDDGKFPVRTEYDVRGNRIKIDYPAIERTIDYTYDDDDRLIAYRDSDGQQFHYRYDKHGRLREMRIGEKESVVLSHDAAGKPTSVIYPNGVRGVWKYDQEGQVATLAYLDSELQTLAGWKHQYDLAGNVTETTSAGQQTTRYTYDAAGQLVEERSGDQSTRFRYHCGGNRASQILNQQETLYQYDESDQLLAAGDAKFKHDANGNLIERTDSRGTTRYHFDIQDQLVRVDLPEGETVEYGYAPTGERIWRRDAQGFVRYLTDGVNVLAEIDEGLQRRATYVHLPGIDRPLGWVQGDDYFYSLSDRLGNIRSVTDEQGQVVATYDYDTFGTIKKSSGAVESPFTFTGREFDAKTRLYYYRARYYDADTGRFLSPDPAAVRIEDPLSLNSYIYVRNNPARFIDPMGTVPIPVELRRNDSPTMVTGGAPRLGRYGIPLDAGNTPTVVGPRLGRYGIPVDAGNTPTVIGPRLGRYGIPLDASDTPTAVGPRLGRYGIPLDAGNTPTVAGPRLGRYGIPLDAGNTPTVAGPRLGRYGIPLDAGNTPTLVGQSTHVASPSLSGGGLSSFSEAARESTLSRVGRGIRNTGNSISGFVGRHAGKLSTGLLVAGAAHAAYTANPGERSRAVARFTATAAGGAAFVAATAAVAGFVAGATVAMPVWAAMAVGTVGITAAGITFDRFFPPGRRKDEPAIVENDPDEKTEPGWINVTPTLPGETDYRKKAQDLLTQGNSSTGSSADNYRERAKAIAATLGGGQNLPTEDYVRRARDINRQLTDRERREAARLADYNRRVREWEARQRQAARQRAAAWQQSQRAPAGGNSGDLEWWQLPVWQEFGRGIGGTAETLGGRAQGSPFYGN